MSAESKPCWPYPWPKVRAKYVTAAHKAGARDATRCGAGIELACQAGMSIDDALQSLFKWQPELRWKHRR